MFATVDSSLLVFFCLPLFTRVYLCLQLFTRSCLPMFTHVYSSLPMFTTVYLCMFTLFTHVKSCLPLFIRVYVCLPLCTCSPMFTYVFILFTSVNSFLHMCHSRRKSTFWCKNTKMSYLYHVVALYLLVLVALQSVLLFPSYKGKRVDQ